MQHIPYNAPSDLLIVAVSEDEITIEVTFVQDVSLTGDSQIIVYSVEWDAASSGGAYVEYVSVDASLVTGTA